MEGITREEYNQSLERLHSRIDNIDKTTTRIEISAQSIKESVDKMFNCIYGTNGKDGLITKVSNLWQKVSGIYWLGSVIIIAFIGSLVAMIFKK